MAVGTVHPAEPAMSHWVCENWPVILLLILLDAQFEIVFYYAAEHFSALQTSDWLALGITPTVTEPSLYFGQWPDLALALIAVPMFSAFLLWGMFRKAGIPGWWAMVPVLNVFGVVRLAGKPWWGALTLMIPLGGILVAYYVARDTAALFGKGAAYTIMLLVPPLDLVAMPLLGYGPARYEGSLSDSGSVRVRSSVST